MSLADQRIRIDLPRDAQDFYVDTGVYDEAQEEHILEGMARTEFYADEFVGKPNTIDKTGRYRCYLDTDIEHSCNRFNPDPGGSPVGTCTSIEGDINGVTGGCDIWEIFRGLLDPESEPAQKLAKDGIYVEHQDGNGFGCWQCDHGQEKAIQASSKGRDRFCRMFGVRVFGYACCKRNERTPVIIFVDGQAKLIEKSGLSEFVV